MAVRTALLLTVSSVFLASLACGDQVDSSAASLREGMIYGATFTAASGDSSTGNDSDSPTGPSTMGPSPTSPSTTSDATTGDGDSSGDSTTGGVGGPKYRDNDGDDPFTAGCWEKYNDASCNGTPTRVGDRCGIGYTGPTLDEYHTDVDCGDYESHQYNCKQLCMTNNHNSGICTKVDISCGGDTVTSGFCDCSETDQDHGSWAIEPDGRSPGTAASLIRVWFEDDSCVDGHRGSSGEHCLDDKTLEEYFAANDGTTVIGSCGHLYSYPVDCQAWCVGEGHDGGGCGYVPMPGQNAFTVTAVCKCTDETTGTGDDTGDSGGTDGGTTYGGTTYGGTTYGGTTYGGTTYGGTTYGGTTGGMTYGGTTGGMTY